MRSRRGLKWFHSACICRVVDGAHACPRMLGRTSSCGRFRSWMSGGLPRGPNLGWGELNNRSSEMAVWAALVAPICPLSAMVDGGHRGPRLGTRPGHVIASAVFPRLTLVPPGRASDGIRGWWKKPEWREARF